MVNLKLFVVPDLSSIILQCIYNYINRKIISTYLLGNNFYKKIWELLKITIYTGHLPVRYIQNISSLYICFSLSIITSWITIPEYDLTTWCNYKQNLYKTLDKYILVQAI